MRRVRLANPHQGFILSDLGLNTNQLDSVRADGIQVLPGS